MVMDAVENCIKAIMNYNVEKATRTGLPNAFAYFTQISYYAFLRRIAKEKKQQDIKERYIAYAGADAFADFDSEMPTAQSDNIIGSIRAKNQSIKDKDLALKEFKKKTKKTDKPSGIELFF
jgi:metal-dependent amidase/aminoacylase/carboxypeptidase family protein